MVYKHNLFVFCYPNIHDYNFHSGYYNLYRIIDNNAVDGKTAAFRVTAF